MRRPSPRGFKSNVTFFTKTSGPDASGDSGAETYSAGQALVGTACVQLEGEERVVIQGKEVQFSKGKIVFRSGPVDVSAGARSPGLPQIRDRFLWVTDLGVSVMLYALGPAVSQSDRGQSWVVQVATRSLWA